MALVLLSTLLPAAHVPSARAAADDCRSYEYACTPGYTGSNASQTWAWKYYGSSWASTPTGYHNCTLYAAWRLARNGMPDPGRSWGNAYEWAGSIGRGDRIPRVGSIAWWGSASGSLGHVAYVEQVSGSNVFIRADNYSSKGGYTTSGWIPASSVERFLHPYDVVASPVSPGWVRQDGTWASETAIATITGGWEMFHIGSDSRIYRKRMGAAGWTPIAGPRAKKIATTTSSDGRVELFYIGLNNQIYHHWESSPGGDISNWQALGGYATDIAAARAGSTWEVFHIGGDGAIYRARQNNKTWERMGGTSALSLAAATSRDGRVELFHTGGGRNVFHAWQSSPGGGFGGWVNRGGVTYDLGATSVGNGEWELYAIGGSNTIWRIAPWSRVHSWQQIAGGASRVAATKHPDGRVEVLVVGNSGTLFHAWQKSVGWF